MLVALALVLAAIPGSARAGHLGEAPGLRVELLNDSRVIDSREITGKKVLVVRFQASYCRACARESRSFSRLVERYRGLPVEFVAVHVQDTEADTRKFIRAQKVAYPVALDPQLNIGNRFGFKGTPYTVVMNLKGHLVARLDDASALDRLPAIIDAALREAPPGS